MHSSGSDDHDQADGGDSGADTPPSGHGDRHRGEDEHLGRRTTPGAQRHDDGDENGNGGFTRGEPSSPCPTAAPTILHSASRPRRLCGRAGRSPEQASLPQSPMTDPVYEGPAVVPDEDSPAGTVLALIVPAAMGLVASPCSLCSTAERAAGRADPRRVRRARTAGHRRAVRQYLDVSVGIGISLLLWFFVGVIASRIATRNPMATFADFWRAYRWLAIGVWIGVLAALAGSSLILGRELL